MPSADSLDHTVSPARPRPAGRSGPSPHEIARIASRPALRMTGSFASEKLRGPVEWTTPEQRDAMALLELNADVASYRAWARDVPLRALGCDLAYRPSMSVGLRTGGSLVLDVAPDEQVGTPPRVAVEAVVAAACAADGARFASVRRSSLLAEPRRGNAWAVLRARGWSFTEDWGFRVARALSSAGGAAPLGRLRDEAAGGGRELHAAACVLAMRGRLRLDLGGADPDACVVSLARGRASP